MICKIQPQNPKMKAILKYNEKKVSGPEGFRDEELFPENSPDEGHVLITRNVPEGKTLEEVFEERWLASIKKKKAGPPLKNQTFHMSVNPSEDDRQLSERETVELIDRIMADLGYKDQPYRIYKHTDTDRIHYHVVSSRIDENGKKINDSYDWLRLREILKRLAPEYGFSVILSEEEAAKEAAEKKARGENPEPEEKKTVKKGKKTPVKAFDRSAGPTAQQLKDIAEEGLKWHFSTFEQYQAILLRKYRVLVELENGTEDKLVFSGTDDDGIIITPPHYEAQIGAEILRELQEKAAKEKMRNRPEQKERLEKLLRASANLAGSYNEFVALARKKGVIIIPSINRNGEVFGVTYIDMLTKCAWKGSETMTKVQWLKDTAESKGWIITADPEQNLVEKRRQMPSRKAAPEYERKTVTRSPASGQKKLRGYTGRLKSAYSTHGSTAIAGEDHDDDFSRRRDDDKPAELVQ